MLRPITAYVFSWQTTKTYRLVHVTGATAEGVRCEMARIFDMPWADIYKKGGRVVKCTITPAK